MRSILILFFILSTFYLPAQKITENNAALDLARRSMDKMYNLENDASIELANQLEKTLPGHPASSFLMALNRYWKNMSVNSHNPDYEDFHLHLLETLNRAEKLLSKDKNNEEGIFFSLAVHSNLAQFYAEENSKFKALKEAKNAYSYMKTGFTLVNKNPEFYYTTGLYNYYREQYPDSHPIYKSFMWFFASGDKIKGLQQLDKASKEALFTKTEALNYVAHIFLHYEDSPIDAEKYISKLVKLYPGNHLYRALYSETLLNMNKYHEAIPHIMNLTSNNNHSINIMGEVFNGILLEKQENKLPEAKAFYFKVIEKSKNLPLNVNHYVSMAYCGLGRISIMEGNKNKAKDYFKQVLEISNYPSVRKEAEEGLKKI